MKEKDSKKNKHMTLDDRIEIQECIYHAIKTNNLSVSKSTVYRHIGK